MRQTLSALALSGLLSSLAPLALAQPAYVDPKPDQAQPEGRRYFCPMKCEGEKTYDAEGRCPVCRMKLKPVPVAAPSGPSVTLESPESTELKPNQPTDLTFKVTVDLTPVPPSQYDLLILSTGSVWTEHARVRRESSRLILRTQLPSAGEYVALALEEGKTLKSVPQGKFTVPGESPTPKPAPKPGDSVDAGDGYKVGAFLKQASVSREATLDFTISREGDEPGPVSLKAGAARLFLLTADLKEGVALRAEPLTTGRPTFKVELPKRGQYKAILEFDHEGKTRRAVCTIDAS